MLVLCLRCRRPLPPEPDGVVLQLGGQELVEAVRVERAAPQTDAAHELLAELARALCPSCGREL